MRLGLRLGLVNHLAQLIIPALVDVHLKRRFHNLAQTIVDHRHMKVFANVNGDAQNPFGGNPSNEFGKCLSALTAQMVNSFLTHGMYLLSVKDGIHLRGQSRMSMGASPVIHNETRPRLVVGLRYFISYIGGFGIGHLQIP
jgi:hypothetical protein